LFKWPNTLLIVRVQLESALRGGRPDDLTGNGDDSSASGPGARRSLLQQNAELRRRIDEDQNSYRRKLQVYQDGQQRQAQLVQKLQAKVRPKSFKFRVIVSFPSLEIA